MCSEKYVPVSQIYLIICGLLRKSLVINEDDSSSVRRTKDSIREELNRRYKPSAKSIPGRYKRLTILSSDQKKNSEKEIKSRMDEILLTCMKMINTCQKTNVCEEPEPSPGLNVFGDQVVLTFLQPH